MESKDLLSALRRFDAYPKTLEDFRIKTFGGAIVTFISGVIMFLLFVSELNYYLSTEVTPELFVDTTRGEKLKINVDISFSSLPCVYLSIDAMDVSGEQQVIVNLIRVMMASQCSSSDNDGCDYSDMNNDSDVVVVAVVMMVLMEVVVAMMLMEVVVMMVLMEVVVAMMLMEVVVAMMLMEVVVAMMLMEVVVAMMLMEVVVVMMVLMEVVVAMMLMEVVVAMMLMEVVVAMMLMEVVVAMMLMEVVVMVVLMEVVIDVASHMMKKRLHLDGTPIDEKAEKEDLGDKSHEAKELLKLDPDRCESCYGAESLEKKCCNTCEDVRESYRRKGWALSSIDDVKQCVREGWKDKLQEQKNEGCQVYGYLEVNKVAGNFHFAPGKSFQQHHIHVSILKLKSGGNVISMNMHDLQPFGQTQFNITHHINHLSFGYDYPGKEYPLDNSFIVSDEPGSMYQYFVKIVPTTYRKLGGEILHTHQFSVTKHKRMIRQRTGEHGLPGVFVLYEFSPMMVQYTESRRSFMHFLTGVCAIIGGIFTVAGLVDSMIYHSSRAIQKKIDLGKAS
ncbi:hypothetical protein QZH41_019988 [Actinostola sp. cb2023]|nr:hypothetical protein QZH41_019988 [Actinostola sp. cb2023]